MNPKRDSRLDVARGVCIVAIVLVHVFRGLHSAGLMDYVATATLDRIAGPWCLSVFAFVGGTFVPRGVQQRGVRDYVVDRVARFFVVYVIWTLLQGGVQLLAASVINTPTSIGALFTWWKPTGQLWYLPFLILVTLVFVPLKPWTARRAPWILGGSAVISVAFWGYDGGLVGTQGLGLVFFFVAGMIIGTDRVKAILDRFSPTGAAVIAVGVLGLMSTVSVMTSATAPTVFWEGRTAFTVVFGIFVALLSSVAVLLLGQAARAWSVLALFGRRSLDIYLAHITLVAGTRIVCVQLGLTSTWMIATLGLLAGVVGSLVVATGLRRIGLGWVFDGPGWLSKLTVRAAATRT